MKETKKRRIALVFGQFAMGGAENMIKELACNIDQKKYQLRVFCINGKCNSELEKEVEKNNLDIVYMKGITKVNLKNISKVWKYLSEYKPDIIHTHIGGIIFSIPWILFHKIKFVHTLHTAPHAEFNKLVQKVLKFLYKINKGVLVTVSKENQELASNYFSLPLSKVEYVNNGVNLKKFYKKKHENITFINVGRQDPNKNQIMIVEAFNKLYQEHKDIRLILVGDGNQHQTIKKKIKENKLEDIISMPGMVIDVENYYALSDVYIQSSFREGLPLSILEAMGAGLPIISTDVGGISDIVKKNGILIKTNNPNELYEAMKMLYSDKKQRADMAKESSLIIKDFSSFKMARDYEKIYEKNFK